MGFKERIKQLREEKELTHSQLAAMFGKSEGAIRSWEMGRSNPDLDTLIKLAEYFDCTTDYLLGLSNSKNLEAWTRLNSDIDAISEDFAKLTKEYQESIITLLRAINQGIEINNKEFSASLDKLVYFFSLYLNDTIGCAWLSENSKQFDKYNPEPEGALPVIMMMQAEEIFPDFFFSISEFSKIYKKMANVLHKKLGISDTPTESLSLAKHRYLMAALGNRDYQGEKDGESNATKE